MTDRQIDGQTHTERRQNNAKKSMHMMQRQCACNVYNHAMGQPTTLYAPVYCPIINSDTTSMTCVYIYPWHSVDDFAEGGHSWT